jgi:hypothetical protein
MQRYLLRQQAERKQAGSGTLYNTMRLFWQFYAAEYQTTSPMLGIPRPRVRVAPVPVLAPETAQGDLRRAGEAGSARPPGRHASTSVYLNGTGATAHAIAQRDRLPPAWPSRVSHPCEAAIGRAAEDAQAMTWRGVWCRAGVT